MVKQEYQVIRETQEYSVLRVKMVTLEQSVQPVHKVMSAKLALKDPQVPQDPPAKMAQMVPQVQKEPLVKLVCKVTQE